ncbi:MAG: hypothetical protein HY773_00220 [Candidatus Terrybacteria bacterium]|nr:hypothetical protein [Candidatus Terrybacteria bacterium]
MRKLLPQLRSLVLWKSIDRQIENWYKELSFRNFWNAIHGISMSFRLKSLVPWITSKNMQWAEKDIFINNLWFGGKFGPIKSLKTSEAAKAVKENIFLQKNKKILNQTKKILKEKSSETYLRDNFPIFVVGKEDKFVVIDGNRRLLQAIVSKKQKIRAYIGEPIAKPPLFEHWVPTSLLVDLVFWHKRQVQNGRNTTDTMARTIAELIRDSSAGRIEFAQRSIHRDDKIHMKLLKAVARILKEYNILLKISK